MSSNIPVAPDSLTTSAEVSAPAGLEPTHTTSTPPAAPVPTEAPSGAVGTAATSPPKPEPGPEPVTNVAVPTAEPTSIPITKSATAPTPAAEAKEEEPQNALTEKFTPAEWNALKEFRGKISAIVTDAFSDSPDPKPSALELWGVPVHPDVKDPRASVILMKFLRARNLSPTSAGEMLTATIRWRNEFKVNEVVKEEFPAEVFGSLGHLYGADREGHPAVYNLYGANQDLQAVFGDVQRFLRWRVKLMEQCIAKLDFSTVDQMVQVHDYAGVSMRNRDANSKNAASEATSIFQSHYPEFLSRKFFINVPSLLSWIFWLFKSLVSARTFAKMSVVGSGNHEIKKALSEVIDEKQIPKRYGGLAEGF